MEPDNQFTVFLGDEILVSKNKDAVLTFSCLHVAMFTLDCINQAKVNTHGVSRIARPERKGVITKILARLDVILITVGPVKFDLLPLIGNRINTWLCKPALRENHPHGNSDEKN